MNLNVFLNDGNTFEFGKVVITFGEPQSVKREL